MRILVTGGGGLIGAAIKRVGARSGADVVALPRDACDVTVDRDREEALRRYRPDAVLFAAAFTTVDGAGLESEALNVVAPARWAAEVPTWFLSSNFIFSGPGPHAPGATPRPLGTYAEQKTRAEAGVLAAGGHVVRVGWVVGPGGKTFGSTLVRRLRAGETVAAIADVLVQPTWADDVAAFLLQFPTGTTHAIGAGEVSWYGFAAAVRARVGAGRVAPVRLSELGLVRPRDARLSPATLRPWRAWIGELVAAG